MRVNIHAILGFVLLLIAVNILLLDIMVFSSRSQPEEPVKTEACSSSCQQLIMESINNITPLPSPTNESKPLAPQLSTREFYIPLGTGSTRNDAYEDLTAAESYIDTNNYSNIKQATFEVYLRNPTGNGRVYAKLFNASDKHDVWFSEVFIEGTGVTRKEVPIILESGKKLYRVMLKSTLRYDAYVDAARIKIITQ